MGFAVFSFVPSLLMCVILYAPASRLLALTSLFGPSAVTCCCWRKAVAGEARLREVVRSGGFTRFRHAFQSGLRGPALSGEDCTTRNHHAGDTT
jgi:hypothetical protein